MAEHPTTFPELFSFYDRCVKLLYSTVQADNVLPSATLFEINAAFDHLARRWTHGESEAQVVEKAYSHLKRSCLDIFKLRVKRALDQATELGKIEVALIDNGDYERNLKALVAKIREGAIHARREESKTSNGADGSVLAFAVWQPVFDDCVTLEKQFYLHPSLNWAKKTGKWRATKKFVLSLFSAAVVGAWLKDPLAWCFRWVAEQVVAGVMR